MKRCVAICIALLLTFLTAFVPEGIAIETSVRVEQDRLEGFNRSNFKHWIDSDKNGCDTRAEVLISEASVKPKIGKKCKLTGGKWLSAYDGKSITDSTQLDVDHLVPLAEAWRSGAWAWTVKQRQDFANDITDSRALIAVSLTANRSKSDKDISEWIPKKNGCDYVESWVAIKMRYSLTYDEKEADAVHNYFETCKFGEIEVEVLQGFNFQSEIPIPFVSPSPISSTTTQTQVPTTINTPIPINSATKITLVKYANCTAAKAAGVTPISKSANPELYTLNAALDRDKDGIACES